jgi:hypothetical protein
MCVDFVSVGLKRAGISNLRFKRRPCEAKIPVDRIVTPVTLIKTLIPQHRTTFLYYWCVDPICCFYDFIYEKRLHFALQIGSLVVV